MMHLLLEALKAILFGIVEGITEWLPVSSTAHMILLNQFVRLDVSDSFMSMFDVVIQLGAILAVIILFFRQIWPFTKPGNGAGIGGIFKMDVIRLWLMVIIAILPSAIFGIPLDDWIDEHLHTNAVISLMLIVYGVLFIVVEHSTVVRRSPRVDKLQEMDVRTAVLIGLFQVLALIPGTSRSGATILGGLLTGCSRAVAAEFTFIMAIPTMAGASLIKLLKFGLSFTVEETVILVVGCVTAFVVSSLAVRKFIDYVKHNSFELFGWYRIILGLLIAIFGVIQSI